MMPECESTSRSKRSTPAGEFSGGLKFGALTAVLPPIPSLITEWRTGDCKARRCARMSSQRSCAFSVVQVPSVIESPNATIAVAGETGRTSTDFSQGIAVRFFSKALPSTDMVWSPPRSSVE